MMKKRDSYRPLSDLLCLFISILLFLPWVVFAEGEKKETPFLHRVSPGESLAAIARRYLSLSDAHTIRDLVQEIQRRNGLDDTLIRPNQELCIPLVRSRPVVARTIPKTSDFEARGIYVNRFSMACSKMTRLVDRLVAHQGNTVILDGKDMSGRLSFPSQVGLASEIGANASPSIRDPVKLFHFLHKKELHICIRLVLFYDPLLANARPDLAIRSVTSGGPWKENGQVTWVDPSHPIVRAYNLDIAKELATMGVDEIQFDYIRFPTGGNTQDAAYVFDEGETPKHQIITDFLAEAHRALSPHKVLVSIDVFGIMAWERPEDVQMTGQRIENLANHCDVINPMIYPSHFCGPFEGMANPGDHPFYCVSEACRRFSTPLEGKDVTLRPWIQAFPFGTKRFGEEYVIEELRALDQSRTCGWLLWSAENAYDVSWKALNRWNNTASRQQSMDCHPTQLLEQAAR